MAWSYQEPLTPAAGHIAFYQQRIDAIYVDGEKIELPQTPWS